MPNNYKYRAVVFFSYSWNDKSHRRVIGNELLEKFGLNVRFDLNEDQNQPIPSIIKTIVEEADALIVLVSAGSMQSRYVIEELARCHERGVRFIPIYLEDVEKRLIPEFLANIPPIRFDPRGEVNNCIQEIKRRLDAIESRHLWKRQVLKQLQRSSEAIELIDSKPVFIQEIAHAVVGTVVDELRQLQNERYERDISIEQNYVHRAIPLFSQARELIAISIADVSTFWVDPETRPAAIRYAGCHTGTTFRLFVFKSPQELNYFKQVLSVNSDSYGDDGGVFVCAFDTYTELFKEAATGFLRVGLDTDFGLLSVPISNGEHAWVKAELDKDNFRFEFVSASHSIRIEDLFQQFRQWRNLRPGDVHPRDKILRWDRGFLTEPQRFAHAMEHVFPNQDRAVCHIVLFKNVDPEIASRVIWPLRHKLGEYDGAIANSNWTGRRLLESEVIATHGNSNLTLKREACYDYVLKVAFDSSKQLQEYYRDTQHRESRRRLYQGIAPETVELFNRMDQVTPNEQLSIWNEIESAVGKKLLRFDFKDEEPFSILVLEPGYNFGETV